ncbi:unnamed protein product, partial [Rotaria magnacalcarata]
AFKTIPNVDNPSTIENKKSNAVDPSAEKLSSPCKERRVDAVHSFNIEKSELCPNGRNVLP